MPSLLEVDVQRSLVSLGPARQRQLAEEAGLVSVQDEMYNKVESEEGV